MNYVCSEKILVMLFLKTFFPFRTITKTLLLIRTILVHIRISFSHYFATKPLVQIRIFFSHYFATKPLVQIRISFSHYFATKSLLLIRTILVQKILSP